MKKIELTKIDIYLFVFTVLVSHIVLVVFTATMSQYMDIELLRYLHLYVLSFALIPILIKQKIVRKFLKLLIPPKKYLFKILFLVVLPQILGLVYMLFFGGFNEVGDIGAVLLNRGRVFVISIPLLIMVYSVMFLWGGVFWKLVGLPKLQKYIKSEYISIGILSLLEGITSLFILVIFVPGSVRISGLADYLNEISVSVVSFLVVWIAFIFFNIIGNIVWRRSGNLFLVFFSQGVTIMSIAMGFIFWGVELSPMIVVFGILQSIIVGMLCIQFFDEGRGVNPNNSHAPA